MRLTGVRPKLTYRQVVVWWMRATDSPYGRRMTRDELDQTLDRMAADASAPEGQPGLVTVQIDDWLGSLSGVKVKCASLQDGMRYRDIQLQVSSKFETEVLSRAEAGARGEPYRELLPKPAGV